MKTRIFLIFMLLSAAAWGAEPAAESSAEPATSAPATPQAMPSDQQKASPTEHKANTESDQAGFSRGSVVRSVFSTEIKDREPVDKLTDGKTDVDHVFYFTELRDMSGQTAIHRWQYKGKVVAEVKFNVRGPRWRVWSSKTFSPNDTGEWKVSVLNGANEVIAEDVIDYTGPAAPTASKQPAQSAPATTAAPMNDVTPQ